VTRGANRALVVADMPFLTYQITVEQAMRKPQHVHRLGGMQQQVRDEKAPEELPLGALALEDAGAFALVLEAIPGSVAEAVTSKLRISRRLVSARAALRWLGHR
jgi:3-methyl-2-oxobutanoate hydroxymethyltransferase